VVVVDTPGLESNDDEWWDEIQPHQNVNLIIMMINGTNDRIQNLNKLNFIYKSLQDNKTHLKVLAIKGNNFEHEDFQYNFLEDHNGNVKFNERFSANKSCVARTTREKIFELMSALPTDQIALFSPVKLIEALNAKKRELKEATERISSLDTSLQTAQKAYASEGVKTQHLEKKVEELQRQYNDLVVTSTGESIKAQRRIGSLMDMFFEEKDGQLEDKTDAWGWHLLSWLPFAGNVLLEKKRTYERRAGELIKSLDETISKPASTKTLEEGD